jgi:hypothetical protein
VTGLPGWLAGWLQVAELAVQHFITNDRPNVAGLILAGSADFKTELSQSDMFDPRLQAAVLGVVDVSYGALAERGRIDALGDGGCATVLVDVGEIV